VEPILAFAGAGLTADLCEPMTNAVRAWPSTRAVEKLIGRYLGTYGLNSAVVVSPLRVMALSYIRSRDQLSKSSA